MILVIEKIERNIRLKVKVNIPEKYKEGVRVWQIITKIKMSSLIQQFPTNLPQKQN